MERGRHVLHMLPGEDIDYDPVSPVIVAVDDMETDGGWTQAPNAWESVESTPRGGLILSIARFDDTVGSIGETESVLWPTQISRLGASETDQNQILPPCSTVPTTRASEAPKSPSIRTTSPTAVSFKRRGFIADVRRMSVPLLFRLGRFPIRLRGGLLNAAAVVERPPAAVTAIAFLSSLCFLRLS